MVQRYDIAEVLDVYENEDGFMTVEVAMTRTGVFPYRQADGSVRMEAKLPEDIFSDETIKSAEGIPVTDRHPFELVTVENYQDYMKGTTHLQASREDNLLVNKETIFDAGLAAMIRAGKKQQVSIGFETEIVEEPGTYDGQEYDVKQTDIRINHLAHVEQGRAGDDVKARLDSGENIAVQVELMDNDKNNNGSEDNMADERIIELDEDLKLKLQGDNAEKIEEYITGLQEKVDNMPELTEIELDELTVNVDDSEGLQEYIDGLQDKIDTLKSEKDKLEGKNDSQDTTIEQLETKLDELKEELEDNKMDTEDVDKIVQDRLDLIDTAREVVPELDASGKTEREIKVAVIKSTDSEFDAEDRSDEYIDARFDGALKYASRNDSYGKNNLRTSRRKDSEDVKNKKNARVNLRS